MWRIRLETIAQAAPLSIDALQKDAQILCRVYTNAFDNQERNLTFMKTDFQVIKLKFDVCNFKQAFYPLHKL